MISYTVVRSQRRTLAIHILPDAKVEVRAPLRLPQKAIEAFVQEKEQWIREKLAFVRERGGEPKKPLRPGDTLPYRGQELPVRLSESGRLYFDGSAFYFPAEVFRDDIEKTAFKTILISFYKRLALPLVECRVRPFADKIGVSPAAIKVSGAEKRWGSCSGEDSLNFSWMLAATDPEALDYVVVHELCHIRHHNHSPLFWRLVESVLPDYKQRQALLGKTEKRLQIW